MPTHTADSPVSAQALDADGWVLNADDRARGFPRRWEKGGFEVIEYADGDCWLNGPRLPLMSMGSLWRMMGENSE
jgi:hypothetical protein